MTMLTLFTSTISVALLLAASIAAFWRFWETEDWSDAMFAALFLLLAALNAVVMVLELELLTSVQ